MKSIVLCENTLVEQSENDKKIIEFANDECNDDFGKQIVSCNPSNKSAKTVILSIEERPICENETNEILKGEAIGGINIIETERGEEAGEASKEKINEYSLEQTKEKEIEPLEEKLNESFEEKTTENLNENLEEKTKENLNENLEEKTKENLNENLEEKTTENLNENLEEKTKENLNENLEEKTTEKLNENLEEKMKETICNNDDGSYKYPEDENRELYISFIDEEKDEKAISEATKILNSTVNDLNKKESTENVLCSSNCSVSELNLKVDILEITETQIDSMEAASSGVDIVISKTQNEFVNADHQENLFTTDEFENVDKGSSDTEKLKLLKKDESDLLMASSLEESTTKKSDCEDEKSVEDIILDEDENKENEKDGKVMVSNTEDIAFSGSPGECEIQVGECQTISDTDKDSIWIEKEGGIEKHLDASIVEVKEKTLPASENYANENEKEDSEEKKDKKRKEVEENEEEIMEIEIEESEHSKADENNEDCAQMDIDESYLNSTISDSGVEDNKCNAVKVESNLRKRVLRVLSEDDCTAKKKRLTDNFSEKNTSMKISSRRKSLVNTKSNLSNEIEISAPKEKSLKDNSSVNDTSVEISKAPVEKDTKIRCSRALSKEKTDLNTSFLTSLRGSLKSLTRSDLEELIVQKFCEAITERSTIGELRRKAQTLEQDQERWKSKVQSLTKLVREMEIVMKKYMSEVQKQTKEGDSRSITPLKVTRSVGLQVSFYSNGNKGAKLSCPQTSSTSSPQNGNGKIPKPPNLKPTQTNVWNKRGNHKQSIPPPVSQKAQVTQPKKPTTSQRSDYTAVQQNRVVVPQAVSNNNRVVQNVGMRCNNKAVCATQTSPQQNQQPTTQHHQNNSKVIDLTQDDDRQPPGKTSGTIRVVNHLQQPQVSQNNRLAYILPATNAPGTGTSVAQGRQVLIATPAVSQPNRQLMCSMPPLLFKGGNVVQQPGPQPQMINQANRIVFPKPLRHPAPLPQPPVNQINRPNLKLLPPRPALKISKVRTGIVLSWNMSLGPEHAPISSYELYAYQESNSPPATSLWKKVGDVKALPLPMACTLTQFMSGHKYHFAVRAVDLHSRIGPFSFPGTIVLFK